MADDDGSPSVDRPVPVEPMIQDRRVGLSLSEFLPVWWIVGTMMFVLLWRPPMRMGPGMGVIGIWLLCQVSSAIGSLIGLLHGTIVWNRRGKRPAGLFRLLIVFVGSLCILSYPFVL